MHISDETLNEYYSKWSLVLDYTEQDVLLPLVDKDERLKCTLDLEFMERDIVRTFSSDKPDDKSKMLSDEKRAFLKLMIPLIRRKYTDIRYIPLKDYDFEFLKEGEHCYVRVYNDSAEKECFIWFDAEILYGPHRYENLFSVCDREKNIVDLFYNFELGEKIQLLA